MINYEAEEQAGNIWEELLEAEKLAVDGEREEIVSFTRKCGNIFTIACC